MREINMNLEPWIIQSKEIIKETNVVIVILEINTSTPDEEVYFSLPKYKKQVAEKILDEIGRNKDIYIYGVTIICDEEVYTIFSEKNDMARIKFIVRLGAKLQEPWPHLEKLNIKGEI